MKRRGISKRQKAATVEKWAEWIQHQRTLAQGGKIQTLEPPGSEQEDRAAKAFTAKTA